MSRLSILTILSDGEFHSGTVIGESLGISRAAVNKTIKNLLETGLEIHRVSGRGYRLVNATPLLAADRIMESLGDNAPAGLHILDETDSTSRYLLRQMADTDISGHVCLAEIQHRGRGRRGRNWQTTPYSNIMMSIAWRYAIGPANLAGLSLAAGVAIVEALSEFGINDVGLKWPNDLMWQQQKLGGVLIDIQGEADGPSMVVLGIGINVRLNSNDSNDIDQQWTDLYRITGELPDRNPLAALLIKKLRAMLQGFSTDGFDRYRQPWQQLHIFHEQPVCLFQAQQKHCGVVEGVDANGALVIRDAAGEKQSFHSGEVSLRSA